MYRPPVRRKFENVTTIEFEIISFIIQLKDRNDNQPQRAQRVDYNRLKRDRAREIINPKPTNTNSELHEYAFHDHNNGRRYSINSLFDHLFVHRYRWTNTCKKTCNCE
jgi:hypothetical protein